MCRNDYRHLVLLGKFIKYGKYFLKVFGPVNVFFAMYGDKKVFSWFQVQGAESLRQLYFWHVIIQHFFHRAAGEVYPSVLYSFRKQMTAGMFGIYQVKVGNMIDHTAVYFFGHIEIEAAVAGFHMKNGDMHTLCHIGGQAGVGVAEYQQRIWLFLNKYCFGFADNIANGRTKRRSVYMQEMIGFAQFEFIPENFVELIIVVLPGMNDDMVNELVEETHYP